MFSLTYDHQMVLDEVDRTIYVFGGRILAPSVMLVASLCNMHILSSFCIQNYVSWSLLVNIKIFICHITHALTLLNLQQYQPVIGKSGRSARHRPVQWFIQVSVCIA